MSLPVPSEQTHLSHPKYRVDIDGLRAIAVLSVVGFHAFPGRVMGGFVGVDIFFIISGFLISSIILSSLNKDTFSFSEFYERRVRRIFPALILVLAACYVFGWFALLPDEYKQLGKHITASAGFVSNLFFWQEAGYFDNTAETKPLLHLWSLGIEEQFYIVWPLLLYLAWKRRFNFLILAATIAVISFTVNVSFRHSDPIQAFYSPLTRFWELLMGSILAYLTLQKVSLMNKVMQLLHLQNSEQNTAISLRNAQSILGALLIGLAVLLITKDMAFPGWWALLPAVGTCFIISAGQHAWFNRVVLSRRILVWIGLISYPLYLWHWPLLSFARIMENRIPSYGIRLVAITLALVFAWLTYRLVEHPLRFGKHGKSKVITLTLIMSVLASLGYATYTQDGLKQRLPEEVLVQAGLVERTVEKNWLIWSSCGVKGEPRECRILNPKKVPDIALLGDSHAMHFALALEDIYSLSGKNIIVMAKPGCFPFFEKGEHGILNTLCNGFMENALNSIMTSASIKTVVLGNFLTARIDGNKRHFSRIKDAMYSTLSRLVGENKDVIFMVDVAVMPFDPIECVPVRPIYLPNHQFRKACSVQKEFFYEQNKEYHQLINAARKEFPMVKFIDAYEYFCDEITCNAVVDGKLLYRDDHHLNAEGAHYLAKKAVKRFLN